MIVDKKEFIEWLDRFLKEEHQTERYHEAAWKELEEKEACGLTFEISQFDTFDGRPHVFS
jgi:hypothetical protein